MGKSLQGAFLTIHAVWDRPGRSHSSHFCVLIVHIVRHFEIVVRYSFPESRSPFLVPNFLLSGAFEVSVPAFELNFKVNSNISLAKWLRHERFTWATVRAIFEKICVRIEVQGARCGGKFN